AELQKFAIDRFGEESGAAVVLDIETGDILAFVSTPAFDPNDFVNGISSKDYALLRDDVEYSPLYHKAYDGTYPPGSTFKMVVAAAALEAGVINPNERVYCPGHYRFGNNTWHCWKKRGHGSVNMHWAIKGSCDVYFYEIAKRMGIENLADMGRRFGFGQRWELGLTGGRSGVMPDDAWKRAARGEPWYEGETLNIGIGQGQVSTSPLQLAVMSARIAAEGKIVTPRIIGDGPRPDTDIPFDEPLDPEIMQRMKAGMYGVTSEAGGTALRSGDLGLGGPRLAGKTGTSQVRRISAAERASGILKGDNIARRLRDHALFVAYAPHDDPKYAISVVVEHGEGGSKAAAPVARDIIAEALRIDARRTPSYIRTASAGSASGTGSGAR
ncbi:MAG: penicillin-binding protein 2, partial [Alphaproteobacteria bacterium]|nr:penicillin-binding protein 2 [Alphaproteobacteria bacterium]